MWIRRASEALAWHRRVPQARQLVVQAQQRDGEAGHLETGDVVADQRTPDGDAFRLENLAHTVERNVQLDEWTPPMPLTNARTVSPDFKPRSLTIGSRSISAISFTGASGTRRRPGSPWMPIPISISSSPSSKVGVPAAGTTQLVRAIPMSAHWH